MSLFSKFTLRRHCPGCNKKTGHHVGEKILVVDVPVETSPGVLDIRREKKAFEYSVCTKCGLLNKDTRTELPALVSWYKQWPYARR